MPSNTRIVGGIVYGLVTPIVRTHDGLIADADENTELGMRIATETEERIHARKAAQEHAAAIALNKRRKQLVRRQARQAKSTQQSI